MNAVNGSADLLSMSGDDDERVAAIRGRMERLGISEREFATRARMDRGTIRRLLSGEGGRIRPATFAAVESTLDDLEEEVGMHTPTPAGEGLVTFRLSGQFGVDVVVEGPVSNLNELERSVEKLLRQLKTRDDAD